MIPSCLEQLPILLTPTFLWVESETLLFGRSNKTQTLCFTRFFVWKKAKTDPLMLIKDFCDFIGSKDCKNRDGTSKSST